ncbi:MAG: response regulator [Phycisphaerales bacterium]
MTLGDLESIDPAAIVYIVDDNPQNRELVAAYLEDLGCRVIGFSGGPEALAASETEPPSLVLLDIMMPVMSGFTVCERLRDNADTAKVPIIMLTALNEGADVERAVEAGADDFLIKPVQRLELLARVRSQLKVVELRSEIDKVIQGLRDLARA